MLRSIFFVLLCLVAGASHAQFQFGVQAGYNLAKWKYTVEPGNWETTTDPVSSFSIGGLGQYKFKNRIRLEGGLLFSGIGTKLFYRYRFNSSSRTIRLYNLNLPVIVMYGLDVKKFNFALGGGFYGACMLTGTEKGTAETVVFGNPTIVRQIDNKVEFDSDAPQFDLTSTNPINVQRFDAGYVFTGSVEYKKQMVLRVSYYAGQVDILPGEYFFSGNFRNRVVNVSLAVWL